MDFGTFMDLFHNSPVNLGSATPPASLGAGLNSSNMSQFAPGDVQAPGPSPLASLGKAFQSNGQDPGLPPLPEPHQQRSAFLMNILPQLMQSIGSNMLGRMGSQY